MNMNTVASNFVEAAARAGEARDSYRYDLYEIENAKLFAMKEAVLSSPACIEHLKNVAFGDTRPWVRMLAAAAIMTIHPDIAKATFYELRNTGGMVSIDAGLHLSILEDMQKPKS